MVIEHYRKWWAQEDAKRIEDLGDQQFQEACHELSSALFTKIRRFYDGGYFINSNNGVPTKVEFEGPLPFNAIPGLEPVRPNFYGCCTAFTRNIYEGVNAPYIDFHRFSVEMRDKNSPRIYGEFPLVHWIELYKQSVNRDIKWRLKSVDQRQLGYRNILDIKVVDEIKGNVNQWDFQPLDTYKS